LVQIRHWKFTIFELVLEFFLELIEYLIVELSKEHELANGEVFSRWCEGELNRHKVSLGAKSALIPEILLLLLMLARVDFETIFQGDHAAVAVAEFFVDVQSWMGNAVFFVLLVALGRDFEAVGNVDSIGVVVLAEAETGCSG